MFVQEYQMIFHIDEKKSFRNTWTRFNYSSSSEDEHIFRFARKNGALSVDFSATLDDETFFIVYLQSQRERRGYIFDL